MGILLRSIDFDMLLGAMGSGTVPERFRRSSGDPQAKRKKRIVKRQELSEHEVRVFLAFLLSLSKPSWIAATRT